MQSHHSRQENDGFALLLQKRDGTGSLRCKHELGLLAYDPAWRPQGDAARTRWLSPAFLSRSGEWAYLTSPMVRGTRVAHSRKT
ncbi:MAG: hypothetical protein IMY76_09315 [Chloroflexi bacterium]|nr:hypothetical protein [Chloroflexota bacterium]